MIKIPGSVNNTMNLNTLATNYVKDEISFNDQDPISVFTKFGMPRDSSKKRMVFKLRNSFVKSVDKGKSSTGTVSCDELQNRNEIILGNRKVPNGCFTGHSLGDGALSSFVGE
jgi:hypothetical protein